MLVEGNLRVKPFRAILDINPDHTHFRQRLNSKKRNTTWKVRVNNSREKEGLNSKSLKSMTVCDLSRPQSKLEIVIIYVNKLQLK